jgi:glycosyltransferase involved in cell wall biosynthesis
VSRRITRPARVLLVCPGLDHAMRGFESFARECFEALRGETEFELELIKGSGASAPGERAVPTLRRDRALATALARASGRPSFLFEQLAFAISLQPVLLSRRPDVVYFSEWHTGRALALLRSATGRSYRLVLCNGTMAVEGFEHLDHVQELTPAALDVVLERGADPARHAVLPLGFDIDPSYTPVSRDERLALRRRLGLPTDRAVVLSVAALNDHHKRLRYLIEEIAALPEPRPFLLLAGQPEDETPAIRSLAHERLGPDSHSIRTVPHSEVADLYRAADVFVLASLGEGLPRALIEAMSHGLPCFTHAYGVPEFVLGEHARMADLTEAGALAQLLSGAIGNDTAPDRADARHRFAYERFSWDVLRPRYVALFTRVAFSGNEAVP